MIEDAKKLYDTDIEIINSRIEYAGSINYGTFFIKVNTEKNTTLIENYFNEQRFNIQKIGYVRNNH